MLLNVSVTSRKLQNEAVVHNIVRCCSFKIIEQTVYQLDLNHNCKSDNRVLMNIITQNRLM